MSVAEVFGINPFNLTESQLGFLHLQMAESLARKELRQRSFKSELTPNHLYNLVLMSTEDQDLAEKHRADYIMEMWKANQNAITGK